MQQSTKMSPALIATGLSLALAAPAALAGDSDALSTHLDAYWSDTGANSSECKMMVSNPPGKMAHCMSADNIVTRLQHLQDIANGFDGTRAAGLPGYDASVNYVADELMSMGYEVTYDTFNFNAYYESADGVLMQTAPGSVNYAWNVDFTYMSQTESGDVTAAVEAVDLDLGAGNSSSSGCDVADFAGFTPGNIALIQRGACSFQLKAENAANAGAVGAIIFNQGNADSRIDLINGTLGSGYSADIPVMFATYTHGEAWAGTAGLVLNMVVDVIREERSVSNVIAETAYGDADNIVMLGAHLDSVFEGPGINDNGSGSAAILELADLMKNSKVKNKVRFAWWGAEEAGLVGSTDYVSRLSQDELDRIKVYLNFDMIASPNYFFGIYDGDGSDFGLAGPTGSAATEALFEQYYTLRGLPYRGSEISFRSDYAEFFLSGVVFGGLFTGAEGIKTEEEVALYGGTAGDQYDPCYHSACDTIDNRSNRALEVNADAIAYVASTLANSTAVIDAEIAAAAEAEAATMRMRAVRAQTQYDITHWGKYWIK